MANELSPLRRHNGAVELNLHYLLTPAPDEASHLRRLTLGENFGGAQCPLQEAGCDQENQMF